MSFTRAVRFGFSAMAVLAVVLTASPAWAQDRLRSSVTGGLDVVNQYNFRGIRQNTDGVSIWPYIDFGFTPFRGDGGLKTVGVNVGTWNAFNSQINDGRLWHRQQVVRIRPLRDRRLWLQQGGLAFTYTSYTSPADLFAHVKELAVKVVGSTTVRRSVEARSSRTRWSRSS